MIAFLEKHFFNLYRSLFLGGINVSDFPATYVTAIKQLLVACKDYADIPWIINTMGFSQGKHFSDITVVLVIISYSNFVFSIIQFGN